MSFGMYVASEIVGAVMLIFAVLSMQAKKMELLTVLQCIANLLVVVQYAMRGELSASGICALATVETLVLYFMNKRNIKAPWFFTLAFISAGLVITGAMIYANGFSGVSDIISISAVFTFNLGIVQSRAFLSRFILLLNSIGWLALNIVNVSPSMIATYVILIVMTVFAIFRLDLREYRAHFASIFGKNKNGEQNIKKNN